MAKDVKGVRGKTPSRKVKGVCRIIRWDPVRVGRVDRVDRVDGGVDRVDTLSDQIGEMSYFICCIRRRHWGSVSHQ